MPQTKTVIHAFSGPADSVGGRSRFNLQAATYECIYNVRVGDELTGKVIGGAGWNCLVEGQAVLTIEILEVDATLGLTSLRAYAPVPEPGAMPLMLAGLRALAGLARRRLRRPRALVLVAALTMAGASAQAALHDRGQGFIYDDMLDLTWLQDTNFRSLQVPAGGGYLTYWEAKAFVESELGFDLGNGRYAADWRLPGFRPVNGLAIDTQFSNDGSTDVAYNIGAAGSLHPGSTASEMGYMFHVNLGNKSYCDVDGLCPQPGWGLLNTGPFVNFDTEGVGNRQFWIEPLGTTLPRDAFVAWSYNIQYGAQSLELDPSLRRARVWAVHPGDIAAVPEPGSGVLMLLGGMYVTALRRRNAHLLSGTHCVGVSSGGANRKVIRGLAASRPKPAGTENCANQAPNLNATRGS